MQHDPAVSRPDSNMIEPTSRNDFGLGHLFWASRDAVIVGGGEGNRILHWNPAAEALFGYTAAEAVGQPFDMLVPEEAMTQVNELIRSLATDADTESERSTLTAATEIPAIHKSGRNLFVEVNVSLVDLNGTPVGFATVRDCTDRLQLQKDLATLLAGAQETARRAEELARIKADLSSLIVHELGSPLGAMNAILDLLDRDTLTPEQRRKLRASMRGELGMLQRLVEDIRAAVSIERGELSVHLEPTDLPTLLETTATSCLSLLERHDFRLEPVPDVRVTADAERISQMLRNLLSNAAKYTPAGTRVRLRATQLDGCVRIEVEDAGPGIAADDLEHIFSKFGRGRDATGRRIPGTGLGLFLSRQFARQHGSDLGVMSEPGTRTIFSFELPEAS